MSALIIGESPSLTYLTYLMVRTSWNVTVYNINDLKFLNENWSIIINSIQHDFIVNKITNNIDKISQKYDLIIMTRKFQSTLLRKMSKFLSLLNPHSLIIVDCTSDPLLFGEISMILAQQVILALHSDVDCRRLVVDQNKFILLNSNYPTFSVGFLSECKTNINEILSIKEPVRGQHAYVLEILRETCKTYKISLNFIHSPRILNKLIWKGVIFVVCFHLLSIIYEEYDILKLSHLHIAAPIMKGCFLEIAAICSKVDPRLFPEHNAESSHKRLQVMILMESNKHMKLKSSVAVNINSMDANLCYYNFVNGFELPVKDMIHSVITLGNKLNLGTQFLQSIQSFILRLMAIRITNFSKIFHLKKSLANFATVNGITPDKNMMNFPPFNPLPLPTPPLNFSSPSTVMMVLTDPKTHNNGTGDNESTISIDSEIKQMVNEYSGDVGGDTFYDTVQNIDSTTYTPCPPIGTPYPVSQVQQMPYILPTPINTQIPGINAPAQQFPQNYAQPYAPSFPTQYPYNNGVQIYQAPLPVQYRKPTSFYHLQPTINRNTPVDQLRQSHIAVLQNLGPLSGIETSNSRYGKYDTTTTYVKSANNSRGSKSSSLSSQKR